MTRAAGRSRMELTRKALSTRIKEAAAREGVRAEFSAKGGRLGVEIVTPSGMRSRNMSPGEAAQYFGLTGFGTGSPRRGRRRAVNGPPPGGWRESDRVPREFDTPPRPRYEQATRSDPAVPVRPTARIWGKIDGTGKTHYASPFRGGGAILGCTGRHVDYMVPSQGTPSCRVCATKGTPRRRRGAARSHAAGLRRARRVR